MVAAPVRCRSVAVTQAQRRECPALLPGGPRRPDRASLRHLHSPSHPVRPGSTMAVEDELAAIAKQMVEIEIRTRDDGVLGDYLHGDLGSNFVRLRLEAKTLMDDALGIANNFSLGLPTALTLSGVQGCREVILGAVNHLRRRPGMAAHRSPLPKSAFVDSSRLAALRASTSKQWDLTRLIGLCEELNAAHANDCFMSMAMLLRTILNHVPPLFGKQTFAEIANNYPGEKSFKKSMQNLEQSLRNIADLHLHSPIRDKEVLPTGKQVDFHADLDVLLGEIVRTLK